MRIGLTTPVVTAIPGVSSPWERHAEVDALTEIARAADRLGYDHLTCSEHVAVPISEDVRRGTTYWDPLATLSFLAAHTSRIRLATSVLVLPYHHPVALAKRYGTLDRLSGGRVVLGVGVGSLREEFDLLGADWDRRGPVTDERLRLLCATWGRPRYDGLVLDPTATGTTPTIWVGGRSRRSLRRAVELGTGWIPFGLSTDALAALLAEQERPPGFEVVLAPGRPVDPAGHPNQVLRALGRLAVAGATLLSCSVVADNADHYVDQLGALKDLADRIGDPHD